MINLKYISDTPCRLHKSYNSYIDKRGIEYNKDVSFMPAYHWTRVYNRMSKENNQWHDLKFINPDNRKADYYIIIIVSIINKINHSFFSQFMA